MFTLIMQNKIKHKQQNIEVPKEVKKINNEEVYDPTSEKDILSFQNSIMKFTDSMISSTSA